MVHPSLREKERDQRNAEKQDIPHDQYVLVGMPPREYVLA
jgi:hypothetical protein